MLYLFICKPNKNNKDTKQINIQNGESYEEEKSFYSKIDNSIYDALFYIYKNHFNLEDSDYEFISLNDFNFDNNISYYYPSYRNLYDVYLKDKEFEKIEKSIRPLSYPLWTLSKY